MLHIQLDVVKALGLGVGCTGEVSSVTGCRNQLLQVQNLD